MLAQGSAVAPFIYTLFEERPAVPPMRLLGLWRSIIYSAAALIEDGRVLAAAQEERFTRKRHDAGFPAEAIRYCLATGNVDLDQVLTAWCSSRSR